MRKQSQLVECPYCEKEFHTRGLQIHIACKHPSMQIPLPMDTERRREAVVATPADTEPRRVAVVTPPAAGTDSIKAIAKKAEIALAEIPEITLPTPAKLGEKRKGSGWLLGALIVGAIWVSRRKPSDAVDAAETIEERQGTHLGRGIGGYKG